MQVDQKTKNPESLKSRTFMITFIIGNVNKVDILHLLSIKTNARKQNLGDEEDQDF